ncbi:hypothetical protein NIB75_18920 [Bacteroides uniformis]|nr:hypothetical protein [Bacteroides uniformis]
MTTFKVALRHMLVEVYPVRSCRFILREYRLSLAGRIRTPDGNGRYGPVIIGIVFLKNSRPCTSTIRKGYPLP